MALKSIDFDLGQMAVLVHGLTNAGKTRLAGDMLKHEAQHGPVRFLNIHGEDGALSLVGAQIPGLQEIAITAETQADIEEITEKWAKEKVRAVAIDSAKWWYRLVQTKVLKGERLPQSTREKNEHSEVHFEWEKAVKNARRMAPLLFVISPSDKSILNPQTGALGITPDLPGRMAAGTAGFFDYCFYLEAEAISEKTIKRSVVMGPVGGITTRARVANRLPTRLELPGDGSGGWERIRAALKAAHTMPDQKKEVA